MDFTEHTTQNITYLTAPNIPIKHAFSTRLGTADRNNFKADIFTSLSLSLEIPINAFVCNNQLHGAVVRTVTNVSDTEQNENADALITNRENLALVVFTADCVPILLYDPVKYAIGAIHAGWRGTALNIASATIDKMKTDFGCSPADISASIGPCISKCCFETDADAALAVDGALKQLPALSHESAQTCIIPYKNKYMIDLKETNRLMLTAAGLHNISVSCDCTACKNKKYWSHRVHGTKRGSQASVIQLKK